jgi:hypothetical protein
VSAAYVLYRVLLYDAPVVAAGAFALFPDGKGVINSASRSVKAVLRASKFEILYFQIPAFNQYLLRLIQGWPEQTDCKASIPLIHSPLLNVPISLAPSCHASTSGNAPSSDTPASPQRRSSPSGPMLSGSSASAYVSKRAVLAAEE